MSILLGLISKPQVNIYAQHFFSYKQRLKFLYVSAFRFNQQALYNINIYQAKDFYTTFNVIGWCKSSNS